MPVNGSCRDAHIAIVSNDEKAADGKSHGSSRRKLVTKARNEVRVLVCVCRCGRLAGRPVQPSAPQDRETVSSLIGLVCLVYGVHVSGLTAALPLSAPFPCPIYVLTRMPLQVHSLDGYLDSYIRRTSNGRAASDASSNVPVEDALPPPPTYVWLSRVYYGSSPTTAGLATSGTTMFTTSGTTQAVDSPRYVDLASTWTPRTGGGASLVSSGVLHSASAQQLSSRHLVLPSRQSGLGQVDPLGDPLSSGAGFRGGFGNFGASIGRSPIAGDRGDCTGTATSLGAGRGRSQAGGSGGGGSGGGGSGGGGSGGGGSGGGSGVGGGDVGHTGRLSSPASPGWRQRRMPGRRFSIDLSTVLQRSLSMEDSLVRRGERLLSPTFSRDPGPWGSSTRDGQPLDGVAAGLAVVVSPDGGEDVAAAVGQNQAAAAGAFPGHLHYAPLCDGLRRDAFRECGLQRFRSGRFPC